jgi:hypothetical protein
VHPTPIYETLAMGLVAYGLWQLRGRLRPGAVFATYLVLAGLERFLVEFVRRNDATVAGLSTAQVFSLLLLVGGAAWLVTLRGRRAGWPASPRPEPPAAGRARGARHVVASCGAPWLPSTRRSPRRSRSARDSTRAGACSSAAATPWTSRGSSGPRRTWSWRTTCGRGRGRSSTPSAPTTWTSRCTSPPRPSRARRSTGSSPRRGSAATWPSGGELAGALRGGFAPERIVLHGNAKGRAELEYALDRRVGLIVIDNLDEIALLQDVLGPREQDVLLRIAPGVSPDTIRASPPAGRTRSSA